MSGPTQALPMLFRNSRSLLGVLVVLTLGCDDGDGGYEALPGLVHPAWVVCEGNFGTKNSSLTVLDYAEAVDTTYLDAYRRVNGEKLGDYAHSVLVRESLLFVCVTQSNRVEIIDAMSGDQVDRLSVTQPRDAVCSGNSLYVSSYSDRAIYLFDLPSLQPVDTFRLSRSPDEMAVIGGKLFVSNPPASPDSVISVIDLVTGQVDSMMVGVGAVSLCASSYDDRVYVACSGKPAVGGYVAVVNPNTLEIERKIDEYSGNRPVKIVIGGFWMAYIKSSNGSVEVYDLVKRTTRGMLSGHFNGLAISNFHIYTLDASDFVSNGILRRYDSTLVLQKEYRVGIAPAEMVFVPSAEDMR